MIPIKEFVMKTWKFIVILLSLNLPFHFMLKAQVEGCGTYVNQSQINLESTINIAASKANESIPQVNTQLSVTVYIIKNEDGLEGITNTDIQNAMARLNGAFAPINLKFSICNTITVDNYNFNTVNALVNEKDLLIQHNNPNTINLYFASTVIDSLGFNVAGYTFMPSQKKDAVILAKSSINGSEIIHQFGHFFNLYHTHETLFGKELVSDTNCKTKGDRCCDTPADPFLSGLVTNDCEYAGNAKDSQKRVYIPLVTNYMSYSKNSCRCNFTNDQYYRIINCLQNTKKHLW